MTGALDRPSQGALENRKAVHRDNNPTSRSVPQTVRLARRTVRSIHAAEVELLVADQSAERRRSIAAIDAMLRSQHASRIAAVTARFADRRAALGAMLDPALRAAAARRLEAEETAEITSLALAHGAERGRERRAVLASLAAVHKTARRALRRRQRHQRAGYAVVLGRLRPTALRAAKRSVIESGRLRLGRWN